MKRSMCADREWTPTTIWRVTPTLDLLISALIAGVHLELIGSPEKSQSEEGELNDDYS